MWRLMKKMKASTNYKIHPKKNLMQIGLEEWEKEN